MTDKKVSKLKIKGTDYVIYDESTYQFAETRLAGNATVNGKQFSNDAVTIGVEDITYSSSSNLTVANKFAQIDNTIIKIDKNVAGKVAGANSEKSFQDKTGKYFTLTIDSNNKVVLTEVVYRAPTITFTDTKWARSSNLEREVDSEDSTGSVTKPFETIITVMNGGTPTTTTQGIHIENLSTYMWNAFGDVAVANDGSTAITFSVTGSEKNPSLGDYETVNAVVTISRKKLVDVGYASNTDRNATLENNENGFVCKMNGTAQQLTESTGYKDGVTQTASDVNGYLYIFSRTKKSFAINASKSTIDGTKLAGGALAAIEVNLYSTNTKYYVYRSVNSFTGTVYFKAIV